MMLQVRLVHALGDRLIDLPPRTFESPLVIGRAPEADVQVPVPGVSRRHSLLYAHEGHWYIQDAAGAARTLVNGQAAIEPTLVGTGDVVTLGSDPQPPALTIDPFGLLRESAGEESGRRHADVEEAAPFSAPASRAAAMPLPSWPAVPQPSATRLSHPGAALPQPGQAVAYAAPRAGYAPALPQIAAADGEAAGESTGEPDDWMGAAVVNDDPASKRFYVPKKNTWTPGMIGGVIFAVVAIVGIGGYLMYSRQNAEDERYKIAQAKADQEAADQKAAAAAAAAARNKKMGNLFMDDADRQQKAKDATAAALDAAKPKVAAVDNAAAQDPGRQTDAWRNVESARGLPPKEAVVVYGEYMKQYPGSPYAADVRKFMDEALDYEWWTHIGLLGKERKDLKGQITEKNRDIAQSQDAEFKKTLQEEKAKIEETLQLVEDKLKKLNYLSDEPPNPNDDALMAELRRTRDTQIYDEWKKQAEKRIRESRGQKEIWQ